MIDCINEFIVRAYDISCRHGFHDEETSFYHQMMLVIGEVGEMVESDRKSRRADVVGYDKAFLSDGVDVDAHKRFCFETFIKDTVEDELADVCIRLFDVCGCFGIHPYVYVDDDLRETWNKNFGSDDICELSYSLVRLLCDGGKSDVHFGCVFTFIDLLANHLGIDIDRHIKMKMDYNELRGYKHGKRY